MGPRQAPDKWHRVVFNAKLAEIAGEYLKKGRSVYVEGRLKTRKWADKDGAEKFTAEIIAQEMQTGLQGEDGLTTTRTPTSCLLGEPTARGS